MRIAIGQIRTRAGAFDQITRRAVELSQNAARQNADLLVLPFATMTGVAPLEYTSQEGFLIDLTDALNTMASELSCPAVVPVSCEVDGIPYLDVMLLKEGKVTPLRLLEQIGGQAGASDRQRIPGTPRATYDSAAFTFDLDGQRIGVAFVYEDIEDFLASDVRLDLLLYLSAYSYAVDDAASALGAALTESRFAADAIALDTWIVAVGSLGGYYTQVFTGSSFVINPRAELVAAAPAFEETLLVADVDPSNHSSLPDRLEPEVYNRSLHLWETLTMGLRDYVAQLKLSDVTFVLDGSLGSCVLAALSSDALGPTHVHAIPGSNMNPSESEVADAVASALHIGYGSLSSDPTRTHAANDPEFASDLDQLALATVARATGALPLAHLDKTYLALEATWRQCRGAALLPLGDVYRSDVCELAHLRNTISPVIPRSAFSAYEVPQVEGIDTVARTPELRLRFVDVTLSSHVEWEYGISDVLTGSESPEVAEALLRELRKHEAARNLQPPYLVVTSRTLSDARMPVGMAWADRARTPDERLLRGRFFERLKALFDDLDESDEQARQGDRSQQGGQTRQGARQEEDLQSMLENLGIELSAGNLPEGVSREEVEGSLGDLFGLLQDLVESGGLSAGGQQPPAAGPMGPFTWGSPFSEN